MFLEILKAILMGIVEGITEWLPISSTGHMILVEQVVKFNASEEFMSMFRVVIQLGAILAVVVLFWNKLWPFGLRHGRVCSKPAVWQLWFKVVAATIPVLIISPLDDWFETRFYNYITVAAMLILYGVLFILVENRRTAPHVTRLEQITYREAFIVGVWQMLAIIPGTSRSGATIVGGLLLGLSRACVAEFTFYLAIPVMAGASLLKVVKFALSGAAITGSEVAVLVTGCGSSVSFIMNFPHRRNRRCWKSSVWLPRISLRSWPAQKALPSPAMTTTRTVSSRAISSTAAIRASSISNESALNCCGRLSVSVVTPPASSRRRMGASVSTTGLDSAFIVLSPPGFMIAGLGGHGRQR